MSISYWLLRIPVAILLSDQMQMFASWPHIYIIWDFMTLIPVSTYYILGKWIELFGVCLVILSSYDLLKLYVPGF